MNSHRLRYLLIFFSFIATLVALIAAVGAGASTEVLTGILGALVVLTPAVLDAKAVENRRRDPTKLTIGDDVHTMEVRLDDIEPTPVHRKVRHVPPDHKL